MVAVRVAIAVADVVAAGVVVADTDVVRIAGIVVVVAGGGAVGITGGMTLRPSHEL